MESFKNEDIIRYFVFVLKKMCDKGYRVTDYNISDMSFIVKSDIDITKKQMICYMLPSSWEYSAIEWLGTKTCTTFIMRDATLFSDDINKYKHQCICDLEDYVDHYLLNYYE